jgi:type II secretory pathway pseudopilin PulG
MERKLYLSKQQTKKAQIQIIDLIISLAIFFILLSFIYFSLENSIQKIKKEQKLIEAKKTAKNLLENIIYNVGVPTNWALYNELNSTIKSIGCAESYGVLDEYKIKRLSGVYNQNLTKQLLGLIEFDGDINISYINGTNLYYIGNYQQNYIITMDEAYATYKNDTIKVLVRIWEK